jgi:aminotransferase/cystathionine beta-lyase
MSYNFTELPDRRNSGAFKYLDMYRKKPDVGDDIVPFSTADMEFENAPEIVEGLKNYLDNNVLGYTEPPEAFYDAIVSWMERRHQYKVQKEWIVVSDGVVPALGDLIRSNSEKGDGVIITSPVYYPFKGSIEMNKRRVVDVPLICRDGRYQMDYEALEKAAADPKNKLLIFCNPHNPVGRVWTGQELEKLLDICIRNQVYILDDEIHHDLIMPGYTHTVLANVRPDAGKYMAVCTAPSKSFNLAGMQTSAIIIACPERRKAFEESRMKGFRMMLNVLGYEACRLAYTQADKWLDCCIQVINENARFMEKFFAENMPEVKVYPLEGTYLLWADFRAWGLSAKELEDFMIKEAELFTDEGYIFGETGEGYERFNIACPGYVLQDAMKRLLDARNRFLSIEK